MESHLSRKYTIAELEPGMPEDLKSRRVKASPRMQGSMMMSLRRVSRNPENSRTYMHGDPVQFIDWKAYARTDELIVREHRDEASAKVALVLDPSETLQWPTPQMILDHNLGATTKSKLETSFRVALYLAHAHLTIADTVSIGFLDKNGDISRSWSPRSPADILGVYQLSLKIGFVDALESMMTMVQWNARAFDRTWWFSDFLTHQHFPSLWLECKNLCVVHIFSWLELTASWMEKTTTHRDETRGRKVYLGEQLQSNMQFESAIKDWSQRVRGAAKNHNGQYMSVDDRTSVGDFLHWLTKEAVI